MYVIATHLDHLAAKMIHVFIGDPARSDDPDIWHCPEDRFRRALLISIRTSAPFDDVARDPHNETMIEISIMFGDFDSAIDIGTKGSDRI